MEHNQFKEVKTEYQFEYWDDKTRKWRLSDSIKFDELPKATEAFNFLKNKMPTPIRLIEVSETIIHHIAKRVLVR